MKRVDSGIIPKVTEPPKFAKGQRYSPSWDNNISGNAGISTGSNRAGGFFSFLSKFAQGFYPNSHEIKNIAQKYVYSPPPEDTILEKYVLIPFWELVASCLPLWIEPNTVTAVAGFPSIIFMFALWYLNPQLGSGTTFNENLVQPSFNMTDFSEKDYEHEVELQAAGGCYLSPTIFLIMAVLQFWYQTGDGVDGKQARRTGKSSVIGHFYDHWMDAAMVSCHFEWVLTAMLQKGDGTGGVFGLLPVTECLVIMMCAQSF